MFDACLFRISAVLRGNLFYDTAPFDFEAVWLLKEKQRKGRFRFAKANDNMEITMHPMIGKSKKDDPLVMRHSCDIGVGIGRHREHTVPMQLRLRGEGESTLLRLAVIGGAVILGTVVVCAVKGIHTRMHYAAKYRRKYEKLYGRRVPCLQKNVIRTCGADGTGERCR